MVVRLVGHRRERYLSGEHGECVAVKLCLYICARDEGKEKTQTHSSQKTPSRGTERGMVREDMPGKGVFWGRERETGGPEPMGRPI
jgi:hypothetical protein